MIRTLRGVMRDPLGVTSLVVLCAIVTMSLLAPLIAPHDPAAVRLELIDAPPGGAYPLGGDGAGRDILSRLLHAGRSSLLGALIAVGIAVALGVTAGLAAGYAGRAVDIVANGTAEALLALPAMIVLLALHHGVGSSLLVTMAVLGVLLAPGFFRLVRGLVLGVKNDLYIDAARVSGLSETRIVARHVLGAVHTPIIIQIALVAGVAILLQSGLEFLGLGDPTAPTWGGMLDDAFSAIYVAPWGVLWPGILIAATVASLMLLGNSVRDSLRPTPRTSTVRQVAPPVASAPPSPDALLSVRDLTVRYGDAPVVAGASFDVRPGDVLGVVGESGSGKSQTAFAVLGLLGDGGRVTAGSILFDGQDVTDPRIARTLRGRRIAYVPQDPVTNLDPAFRVGAQLVEPLRAVHGLSRRTARARALALLRRVGLENPQRVFDAYPHELSGGMAQRVLIAGAVAAQPDLLVADEITASLDVTVQAEVLDLLRDLRNERPMAILLISHDLGVIADSCDRVAVMHAGRIVEHGAVAEVFASPQHPHTRMLLDAAAEDEAGRRVPASGGDA